MQSNLNKDVKVSGSLSGTAGVYFVAGELARFGYISLPTVKNTKGVDILLQLRILGKMFTFKSKLIGTSMIFG